MKNLRKTKIICTLGPATDRDDVLRQLMIEGMNVARFNFSHGSHEEQGERLKKVQELREELNLPIATLLDTKGPEIRLRELEGGKAELAAGQKFVLTTEEMMGNAQKVSITYKDLVKDVQPGSRILIDDGLIALDVEEVDDTEISCRVINGGMISNKKGVNVPDVDLSMPYISEKDYQDIVFGIENDFDFIAASFVRTADDVMQIRKIFAEKNCRNVNIISKIENMQGVQNIDEIIQVSDGIMVARGDMGVEIPLEDVPSIQKMIIKKVVNAGKQVITATQMLDSMMKNPRPTRAEGVLPGDDQLLQLDGPHQDPVLLYDVEGGDVVVLLRLLDQALHGPADAAARGNGDEIGGHFAADLILAEGAEEQDLLPHLPVQQLHQRVPPGLLHPLEDLRRRGGLQLGEDVHLLADGELLHVLVQPPGIFQNPGQGPGIQDAVEPVPLLPAQQLHGRRDVVLVVGQEPLPHRLRRQGPPEEGRDLRPVVRAPDGRRQYHLLMHHPYLLSSSAVGQRRAKRA